MVGRRVLSTGVVLAAWLPLIACELVFPLTVGGPDDAGAGPETLSDVAPTPRDGGFDSSAPVDASSDALDAAATTYNDVASPLNWTTFDTTLVNAAAVGFSGGTFDGRYLYLAPNGSTLAVRYDTHAGFNAAGSWGDFDTAKLVDAGDGGLTQLFFGAAFDTRYVYLVPGTFGAPCLMTRFDSQGSFADAASWSTFDTAGLSDGGTSAFQGAVFDGRFLYLAPGSNGIVVRYDTTAPFGTATSWATFDTLLADGGVSFSQYTGGVFDGRYVYMAGGFSSPILRYDTKAGFNAGASWTAFNPSLVNANAAPFAGAGFDGQFVYFVPSQNGVILRYDTKGAGGYTSTSSWASFDTTAKLGMTVGDFWGAAFDGRFMIFVPYQDPTGFGSPGSVVARYDTTANFFDPISWAIYDTSSMGNASGFNGGVFDGRFLYLVPFNNGAADGIVARFDDKSPPSMPMLPAFFGSFY